MITNISRFDRVVDDYDSFRPSYPRELIEVLKTEIGFTTTDIIADIGCGTGISSSIFVERRNAVYGVEPNDKMRAIARRKFENDLNFRAVKGTAEFTTLRDQSVNLVFSGESFHWFDVHRAKKEFQRVLKPGGHVVLVWNERDQSTDVQQGYEAVLRKYLPGYNQKRNDIDLQSRIEWLFEPKKTLRTSIPNPSFCDFHSLKGRLHSSSFCPSKDSNTYKHILSELKDLFDSFQQEGTIKFDYKTNIYWA